MQEIIPILTTIVLLIAVLKLNRKVNRLERDLEESVELIGLLNSNIAMVLDLQDKAFQREIARTFADRKDTLQ